MRTYKGIIVEESFEDNRDINGLSVSQVVITRQENPAERWHIYTVHLSEKEIERLAQCIKPGWYMHFWSGREVVAVYRGRTFKFDYDNRETWKPAVDYGLSVGIPLRQLDFPIS